MRLNYFNLCFKTGFLVPRTGATLRILPVDLYDIYQVQIIEIPPVVPPVQIDKVVGFELVFK